MNAILEIRNSKKRSDNKSVTEFIRKIIQKMPILTSSKKLLKNLSKNKKIVKIDFPISNDQLNESEVTESEPISSDISNSPSSNISAHETCSNCQPLFQRNDFVKN